MHPREASVTPVLRDEFWWRLGLCVALLCAVCAVSLSSGSVRLTPAEVWHGLWDGAAAGSASLIVRLGRAPRLVLALAVGAGLAGAGLLMQTLCRNPLATPSVLGIGNGANLGLLLITILRPDLSESDAVLASFAGAAASAAAIGLLGISRQSRMDRDRLVIGGTVLNSLTASAVLAILFFSGTSNTMLSWTLGRLVNVGWDEGIFVLPAIAIGVAASVVIVRQLDPLSLGDEVASSLGVRVGLLQGVTLAVIVLLAGAAVAVAGPIPYIGLVAPHLFPRNRVRSPLARLVLCLLCGATLAALAEWASRMTSGRQLVPLGIWTMAVGAGVFLSLAITRRERAA